MTTRYQQIGHLLDDRGEPPVLIAPRGEVFHRAPPAPATFRGGRRWALTPGCGTPLPEGHRAVLVDQQFAELLARRPCDRCWPAVEPTLGEEVT